MPYKNIENRRKFQAERYRKLQKMYRDEICLLLGNKCINCNINNPIVLCIDHINAGGTLERRTYGGAYYKKVLDKIKTGSNQYQLLCCNCNQIKKIENKEITNRKYFK